MVDPNVIDNLPVPPPIPPYRTFLVRKPGGTEEVVEAHAADETPSGSLMFFEYGVELTEAGFKPNSKLRRSFATGSWADMQEVGLVPRRSALALN